MMKPETYIGVNLLKIAAFLYVARYIAAALVITNPHDFYGFSGSYRIVGGELTFFSAVSALSGIWLLVGPIVKKKISESLAENSSEQTPS